MTDRDDEDADDRREQNPGADSRDARDRSGDDSSDRNGGSDQRGDQDRGDTGEVSADRRELADAVRDALAHRAAEGDEAFPPLRSRPILPRALDTRPVEPVPVPVPVPAVEPAPVGEAVATEPDATGASESETPAAAESEPASDDTADTAPVAPPIPMVIDPDSGMSVAAPEVDPDRGVEPATSAVPSQPDAVAEESLTEAVPVAPEDLDDEPSSLEAPIDEAGPLTVPRRRITGRGAIAVGARTLTGLVGIAVAVAAITGATVLPGRVTSTPPVATIDPVPAAQQRVCPGPLLRLGDDQGQGATVATSIGRATAQYQASPRDIAAAPLTATENTAAVAPLLLTLPPGSAGDGPSAVAGSQSQYVEAGDLVGFAATECAEPRGDTWLVGGSTDVGRTSLITLSNPTTVIATVDISIYGTTGAVAAPGTEGIVVPPGSQRIFSLAGFAPQVVAPVVRVESRGGLVVANLQQSTVRTLQPGGVDVVAATRGPSRSTVIPGLVISTAAGVTAAQGGVDFDDLSTVLRMYVPGTEATTATVRIEPARGTTPSSEVAVEGTDAGESDSDAGAATSAGFEVELLPGEVTDLALPGLVDGTYTVAVASTQPIVAGVRASTFAENGRTDFSWLSAGSPLQDTTLVSIAPGPSPTLQLVNPGESEQTVTVTTPDGDRDVRLAAGESVPIPVDPSEDITLEGAAGILAAVTYFGTGQISDFVVTSPGPASSDIRVYR